MNDEIQIRPILPTDFTQWKSLWDDYNAFYGRKDQTALPDATTNMTWSRFFDSNEPMHALAAERSAMLLGLVHYIFHAPPSPLRPPAISRIFSRLKPHEAKV